MVIYYDLETKEIKRTEDNTMQPILPMNMSFDEKKEYYREQNEGFICLPYEMGIYIFNFKFCFDEQGNFVGLQPK